MFYSKASQKNLNTLVGVYLVIKLNENSNVSYRPITNKLSPKDKATTQKPLPKDAFGFYKDNNILLGGMTLP